MAPLLNERFRRETVALDFTPATPLFLLLAVVSQSMNAAIVADNALAEARTGLLSLPPTPFPKALEAALQSARIDPSILAVESTDDYVFLYVPTGQARTDLLLNRAALSQAERDLLARRVSVTLPEVPRDPGRMPHLAGARPLGSVLPALSAQLGMEVQAPPRIREIPVNPAVMNGVSVETALNLLIRQWPLPIFGYEVHGRTVLIRQRPGVE